MATVTKRGKVWYVQVRRKGHPAFFKTTKTKAEAVAWGRKREEELESRNGQEDTKLARTTTLRDILERYIREVSINKRGAQAETFRLRKLMLAVSGVSTNETD